MKEILLSEKEMVFLVLFYFHAQTVGAIDGTRIEINSPNGDCKTDYFNRK